MAQEITSLLADMFSDSVGVELVTGTDATGEPTYAASVPRNCRVSGGGKRMFEPGGEEFTTKGKITFDGPYSIKAGTRITLPDDFDDRIVVIRAVGKPRDENGPHHDKAFF